MVGRIIQKAGGSKSVNGDWRGGGLGNPSSSSSSSSMGEGEAVGEGEGGGCCDNHQQPQLLLTEDVLIQILLWLPVISLLRFKSVCKSWRAIIESPFFIHLHATTLPPPSSSSSSKLAGSRLLISRHCFRVEDVEEEMEEKKKGKIFTLSGEEFEVFEDLGRPPTLNLVDEEFKGLKGWDDFVEFFVVGCCNGLICLHDAFTRNVALWNPAIKQSRILPKPSNLLGNPICYNSDFIMDDDDHDHEYDGYTCEDFVGFGIDIKTNDHKVLQITTLKPTSNDYYGSESPSPHERRVHVYNLSTDSWKCITDDATLSVVAHLDLDLDIKKNDQGLYLNGSYFLIATYSNQENKNWLMLLSFDFTGEIFTTIHPPYDLRNRNACVGHVYFIPFGEKLALLDAKREHYYDYEYHIWVSNQTPLGVKESWTKFYTFGPYNTWNPPQCITSNGEFAIIHGEQYSYEQVVKLQLLNIITGQKKDLLCDSNGLHGVGVYKPSLVPIGGNGATDDSRFVECDDKLIMLVSQVFLRGSQIFRLCRMTLLQKFLLLMLYLVIH